MKKIPYGIINYKSLITEGYEYIDKTMYLEKLESIEKTLFYLRPGRFGKSLFTSMMYYYYDINSKDKFDTLFKDTYVYRKPTPSKNNYYVLKFDFSGITTDNTDNIALEGKFKTCVITGINNFLSHYQIEYTIDDKKDSSEIIKYFLSFINGLELTHKIYVIIDEYDNFTNAILEGDAKKFLGAVGNTGFVKSFYTVIKEYIGLGVVDRFFATGICPITLNSMTTGFNIASDLSTDREFNSMIGLTHEEVKNLLSEYDKETQESIFNIMMENYDGYLFSEDLPDVERVFNATLVMYLLSYYERFNEIPDQLTDKNITVNYGKIGNILRLQNNEYYQEILDATLKYGRIEGTLTNEFSLEIDFTRNDIISLLYYFGYLTIKEKANSGLTVFTIPNQVMKETYGNYFLKLLSDINVKVDESIFSKILDEIVVDGTINNITNYISEILKLADNRIFMNYDEKYIQELYFAFLSRYNGRFNTYTEYPVKNGGYADVMLLSRDDVMKHNIMIELKYIKKGEYKKKLLENMKTEGVTQLKNYSEDERINKSLKKYLVIFSGCDVKLIEEVK